MEPELTAPVYTYEIGGRRDPFISLLVNVGPSEGGKVRPAGMQGFLIQELALKGIVKDQSGYIALLLGTDGKSYFARVGQRFFDGVLVAMDAASATLARGLRLATREELREHERTVGPRAAKRAVEVDQDARRRGRARCGRVTGLRTIEPRGVRVD